MQQCFENVPVGQIDRPFAIVISEFCICSELQKNGDRIGMATPHSFMQSGITFMVSQIN